MKLKDLHPLLALILFSVIILISISGCKGPEGPAGPAGGVLAWENSVDRYDDCVYLLGILPSGEDYVVQVGTGWAISQNQIMTNAHVAYGIYDLCRLYNYNSIEDKIVAVRNGTFSGGEGTYELVECSVHPGYNNLNPFSNDFAIFTVDTSDLGDYVSLPASPGLYHSLKAGLPVGTLGFPGELSTSDLDGYQPIATFKDGTISALRPYDQRFTSQSVDSNVIIQYNFSTTGGTSGSPVFLNDGSTIAINNSEIAVIVRDINDNYVRIGLGDINFGIRLDQGEEVSNMPFQASVSDFRNPDPSYYSSLTEGQMRIIFDWDSGYDFDLWLVIGEAQYINGWLSNGSRAYIYPYCVHHGDDYAYGPERATVLQLTNEIKIYASKYSYYTSFTSSYASCEITDASGTVANVTNPPSGNECFWIIGKISTSGEFTLINELTDIDPVTNTSVNSLALIKSFDVQPQDTRILKSYTH